jgi:hypothetical protein
LGIVVKDYYGLILEAKCMEMVINSSLIKVMDALYTVQFCIEIGFFYDFIIEWSRSHDIDKAASEVGPRHLSLQFK